MNDDFNEKYFDNINAIIRDTSDGMVSIRGHAKKQNKHQPAHSQKKKTKQNTKQARTNQKKKKNKQN